MSETLSQNEVDALREAVADGAVLEEASTAAAPEKRAHCKVVAYNFRKPHLLSADQRHAIETAHEGLAHGLQARLTALLRRAPEIKLVALDQISFGEFELSLANPAYLALLETEPDHGSVALELSLPLVATINEIMLGGGSGIPDVKDLTPLDIDMFAPVIEQLCRQLSEDWSGVSATAFRLARNETRPEHLRLTTPETSCMNATLDIHIGSVSGVLNLCYPIGFIQSVFSAMDRRGDGKNETEIRDRMLKALSPVPLDLRVVLGASALTARQVARLKPGDVVCVEREYDEPLDVHVGRDRAFTAHIGKRRGRLAVRLLARAQPEGAAKD
jgi:flagellar motor switch protein FliM